LKSKGFSPLASFPPLLPLSCFFVSLLIYSVIFPFLHFVCLAQSNIKICDNSEISTEILLPGDQSLKHLNGMKRTQASSIELRVLLETEEKEPEPEEEIEATEFCKNDM
jgi:hypothetical protein